MLKLWYESHARDLATPPDPITEAIFRSGHEVGRLARSRYPGGHCVEWDHRHGVEAVSETAGRMADVGVPAVYEAAIEYGGVLIRADVLQREDDGWALIEVKSSTRCKDIHLPDVAVQLWVLRGAGVMVKRAGVLTLNRNYVYDGEALDVEQLFVFHDLTEAAGAMLDDIGDGVERFQGMLAGDAPLISPGAHCFDPYDCPFYAHCTRNAIFPQHPLSELPKLYVRKRQELEAAGVTDVRDVPEDFGLSPLQAVVRQCVISGDERVHGDLSAALSRVVFPVYHLDFETLSAAIPRFAGTRPYDSVPFQFSVHVEQADGTVSHTEYLHGDSSDPREPLALALLDALGETGSICVYTGFEARVIRDLAAALPELAPRLEALPERIWDLHPVIRNNYYHPGFRGSFSIKQVLPALIPQMSYDKLEIGDGALASISYEQALKSEDAAEEQRIFRALREYCEQDTLALVRLRGVLAGRALQYTAG